MSTFNLLHIIKSKCSLILLLLLQPPFVLFGQSNKFKHYEMQDGLPGMIYNNLNQMNDGTMIFGGIDGITFFNGKKFYQKTIADGLKQTATQGVFKSPKGKIWVLSLGQGLSYWEKQKFVPLPNYISKKIEKIGLINQLLFRAEDEIILLSLNYPMRIGELKKTKGIWNLKITELKNDRMVFYEAKPGKHPFALLSEKADPDKPGHILFSFRFPSNPKHNTSISIAPEEKLSTAQCTLNNCLLFSMGKRLLRLSPEYGVQLISMLDKELRFITKGPQGKVWLSYLEGGVQLYDLKTKKTTGPTYFENTPKLAFTDQEGGSWFIRDVGIDYLPPFPFKRIGNESLRAPISSIVKIGDTLLIGHDNGTLGILLTSSDQNERLIYKHNATELDKLGTVINLCTDQDGNILYNIVNTGIFKINRKTLKVSPVALGFISSFKLEDDGSILFNKSLGGYQLIRNGKTTSLDIHGINNEIRTITDIFRMPDKSLILCTNAGLRVWKNGKIKSAGKAYYLNEYINLGFRLPGNNLGFATIGAGLLIFNQKDTLLLNTNSNLISNTISAVSIDKQNRLWVICLGGISVIWMDWKNLRLKKIRNISYGFFDDYKLNSIAEINGINYISSAKSITLINENDLSPHAHLAPVSVSDVLLNGKALPYNNYRFNHLSEMRLQFRFTSISFIPNVKYTYKYRLKGYDVSWKKTEDGHLSYTNLPPGNYVFEVKALDQNSSLQSAITSIPLIIYPKFWQHWLFKSAIAVLFLLTIILLIRIFLRRQQQKLEIKEHLLRLKQEALNAKLNPHFIFNALNSIQNFIAKNDPMESTRYLSKFAKLVRLILDSSSKELVQLDDEIELVKLYLEIEQLRFRERLSYHIEVNKNVNPEACQVPMFLLQPYIENAVWHGLNLKQKDGKIELQISRNDKLLRCLITDNGIGREKATILRQKNFPNHQSHGLKINENRLQLMAELYGQKIQTIITDLFDNEGQASGTSVEVLVELKNDI